MKTVILALVFIGQSALAADNFFCTSEERDQTVQLTQLSDWEVQRDQGNVDYTARYRISIHTTELAFPSLVEDVTAEKFDVLVGFHPEAKLDGEDVAFEIFLDELDQASLVIGDQAYAYTYRVDERIGDLTSALTLGHSRTPESELSRPFA